MIQPLAVPAILMVGTAGAYINMGSMQGSRACSAEAVHLQVRGHEGRKPHVNEVLDSSSHNVGTHAWCRLAKMDVYAEGGASGMGAPCA